MVAAHQVAVVTKATQERWGRAVTAGWEKVQRATVMAAAELAKVEWAMLVVPTVAAVGVTVAEKAADTKARVETTGVKRVAGRVVAVEVAVEVAVAEKAADT